MAERNQLMRQRKVRPNVIAMGGVVVVMSCLAAASAETQILDSQRRVVGPGQTQFQIDFLQAKGGPVIPAFEGWYRNPDGTYVLSFGYLNTNLEEVIDIPIGEDNSIEPAQYNGAQPSHFLPIPEGDRRYYGAFTVTVPADFGDQDVVWTLRQDGQEFSVPGRIKSPYYEINAYEFPGRRTSAPLLKIGSSDEVGRGPAGVVGAPIAARVGEPVRLSVSLNRLAAFADEPTSIITTWFKHQGPGEVTFAPETAEVLPREIKPDGDWVSRATEARFSAPGEYLLRVLASNTAMPFADDDETVFEYHCCWTNGYVKVVVAP